MVLLENSKKCVKRFEMATHVGPIIKGITTKSFKMRRLPYELDTVHSEFL